jgi:hypothetical protein
MPTIQPQSKRGALIDERNRVEWVMAKTDSFFIRKTLRCPSDSSFEQEEIDLGAFVDALGKSVLRCLSVEVIWSDYKGTSLLVDDQEVAAAQFQITTQTQTAIVRADDKSLVASGHIIAGASPCFVGFVGQHYPADNTQVMDTGPQNWTYGYLIGVDSIYLGGSASTVGWDNSEHPYVTVILECQSETLSQSAAMALALSQQ